MDVPKLKQRKWRKGWKVCLEKLYPPVYYKSMAQTVNNLEYKLNELTLRPVGAGPLTVLNSLESAEKAYRRMSRSCHASKFAVFECLWLNSHDTAVWKAHPFPTRYTVGHLENCNSFLVKGATKLADKVILKKKLDVDRTQDEYLKINEGTISGPTERKA